MAENRVNMEISDEELELINGGTLDWANKQCKIKGDASSPVYNRIKPYPDCTSFMDTNCRGMTDLQTMEALCQAGYLEVIG